MKTLLKQHIGKDNTDMCQDYFHGFFDDYWDRMDIETLSYNQVLDIYKGTLFQTAWNALLCENSNFSKNFIMSLNFIMSHLRISNKIAMRMCARKFAIIVTIYHVIG